MRFKQSLYTLLIILPTIFLTTISSASAQLLNNDSISLGFAPTTQFLKLKPGQKYSGELTVWNLSPQTKTFNIIIRGFKQIENMPGTARVHTEAEELRDPFSGASWITVPYKKIFLIPNQYTKIPYEIKVPKDSASGEFNAMIFLLSETPNVDLGPNSLSNSNLGSGPVIFMEVGDKIVEKAEIEYFKTDKPFYELPPVQFLSRYINKSNTHITPAGDIILENFLGQEVDKIAFNTYTQSLLRGNAGNYQDEWDHDGIFFRNGKIAIGPIKARLITTYRSKDPGYAPLNATTTFWVLPWKHILAIILIAGIMVKITKSILNKRVKKNEKDHTVDISYPRYA